MDDTEALFTWLHLSDIHFGHGPVSHMWDQKLVLQALSEDLMRLPDRGIPQPNVILITGDIAFSGATSEYEGATAWIEHIVRELGLSSSDVFVIPGNHDVQRDVDRADRQGGRLIERLRAGDESLDEALGANSDRLLIEKRFTNYLEFMSRFFSRTEEPSSTNGGLYWYRQRTAALGLVIRFVGLNTSLLSADDNDKEKLRVGKEQLAIGLLPQTGTPGELSIVLGHHPLSWLADHQEVASWIRARASVYLCGHVHEGESEALRKGGGTDIVSVVAGAIHSEPLSITGHSYSIGSIIAGSDGHLSLRIWPRSWSPANKDFRVSIEQIPEGAVFVDHDLRRSLPAAIEATGTPLGEIEKQEVLSNADILVGRVIPIQDEGSTDIPVTIAAFHQEYPPLVTAFVGRNQELQLMKDPATVVGITGIGGQGKSALAAAYLQSSIEAGRYEFSDWRDCREEANKIHSQLVAIIERLTQGAVRGSQLVGADDESLVRYLFEILGQKAAVFVFDNIDQYVDLETGRVLGVLQLVFRQALKTGHRARFIVTCRPTLQYEEDGFQEIRLPGLTQEDALRLFQLRGVQTTDERVYSGIKTAYELTQGHALWLNLIATQVARTAATLDALIRDLRRSTSSHLPNAMLRSIWRTLTDKQKSVLRCLAETPKPETEDRLAEFVADLLNWNQYRKAVRVLKTLNLVVIKPEPSGRDTLELHPLIREFIKTEYSPKERERFIGIVCKIFDRVILKFKPQLKRFPSFSILEHWTLRAELAINQRNYKEALGYLHEAADPLTGNGYVEEFVRVGSRLFSELDWTEAVLVNYPYFDWMVGEVSEQLSHLGRYAEADELARRYEEVIIGTSARFIHLCKIRSHSYWLRGDYAKAKQWGRRGVQLKQSANVDTDYDCAHNLALAQRDSDEVEPALKYFLKDQTVDELLRGDVSDSRASDVFGNVGRCLWLKGDIANALRCLRRSARMLESESGSNTLVNQGWAALWLGELLKNSQKFDLAFCFCKRAESRWKSSSPIKAQLARNQIDEIASELLKLGKVPSWAEADIDRSCREWLMDDAGKG